MCIIPWGKFQASGTSGRLTPYPEQSVQFPQWEFPFNSDRVESVNQHSNIKFGTSWFRFYFDNPIREQMAIDLGVSMFVQQI